MLLAIFGLIFAAVLMSRKIIGATLIGIIFSAIPVLLFEIVRFSWSILSLPPSLSPTFLKLDIKGAHEIDFITVTIVFLFIVMFDTGRYIDRDGGDSRLFKKWKPT